MKIRRGDKVKVIVGRDVGKEGTVERVYRQRGRLLVSGVNLLKKFVKKGREGEPAGVIAVAGPIHISNVMLICPKCGRPTKVGFKAKREGKMARVCKQCGEEIDAKK